ncbi:hypothetical protein ACFVUY_38080 [Kitasatospora sp. NPDC058063]|uniref:hypothetical protein n=1 Tax=unclassified Kitasatospora TaxID=2633591 RepID=UPI0036DBAC1B
MRNAAQQTEPVARFLYGGSYSTASDLYLKAITGAGSKFTDKECRTLAWFIGASPGPVPPTNGAPADLAPPVPAAVSKIAADLGANANAFGRIVRHLASHRILVEADKIGRTPLYRVTPYISYKGTAYEQREAIKRWKPPIVPGVSDPDPGTPPCKECESPTRKPRKRAASEATK